MSEKDNPLRPLWNEMKAKDDERRALRARVVELEEKCARCSDAFDDCHMDRERLRARVAELRAFKASVPWDDLGVLLMDTVGIDGLYDFRKVVVDWANANRPQEAQQ